MIQKFFSFEKVQNQKECCASTCYLEWSCNVCRQTQVEQALCHIDTSRFNPCPLMKKFIRRRQELSCCFNLLNTKISTFFTHRSCSISRLAWCLTFESSSIIHGLYQLPNLWSDSLSQPLPQFVLLRHWKKIFPPFRAIPLRASLLSAQPKVELLRPGLYYFLATTSPKARHERATLLACSSTAASSWSLARHARSFTFGRKGSHGTM